MPYPARKLVAWIGTTLLVLLVVYPLSYAPVVRVYVAPDLGPDKVLPLCDSSDLPIYVTMDWLIDNTQLSEPMFVWARLWQVEYVFRYTQEFRAHDYQPWFE